MLPQEEIDNQQELLREYRRTLAHYLRQQAKHGTAYVPPAVTSGIREARNNIRRIKATLRSCDIVVEDYPDDVESNFADSKDESATNPLAETPELSSSKNSPIWLAREALLASPVSPHDDFVYNVFISYRQQEPDRAWVRQILLPQLEAAGLRVCIDYRDFNLGAVLVKEIERAIEQSRYTLAVMSPSYLTSNFTELENVLAEHRGLEAGHRRLLAVMREECKPRLGMRARLWLDMTNDEEFASNLVRLISEIRRSPDD